MADDRDQEPQRDGGREPDPRGRRTGADGTMWAFLPVGITFLVLGISEGTGDGSGTTFFIIGVTFLVIGLTAGGTAGTVRRRRGTGQRGDSGPEGEPGGPAHP